MLIQPSGASPLAYNAACVANRSNVVATKDGTRAFELRKESMYECKYKSDKRTPRTAARLTRWRASVTRTDRLREQVMGRRAREVLRMERLLEGTVYWLVSDGKKREGLLTYRKFTIGCADLRCEHLPVSRRCDFLSGHDFA